MSEVGIKVEIPLNGGQPEPQQPTNRQEASTEQKPNAEDPSTRLVEVKKRWEGSKRTPQDKRAFFDELKKLTPEEQPYGAIHLSGKSKSD